MSLYRRSIENGVLVRQKRKLLRRWLWYFNRSEEDHLNRMKNKLLIAKAECTMYQRRIPQEEDRIKKIKDGLMESGTGATSNPTRDSWTPRTEPVKLFENVKVGRPKKDRPDKPKPTVLAKLTTA